MTSASDTRGSWAPRNGLLVTAAAGYGKSTFLEALLGETGCGVRSAADLAELDLPGLDLAGLDLVGPHPAGGFEPARWAPAKGGSSNSHLVINGFLDLPYPEQLRLARVLAVLPEEILVSLAGRRPPAARVLAAVRRPFSPRGPGDLALSTDAVARVLCEEHDVPDLEVASTVSALTAGWPMLVQLAGATLRQGTAGSDLLAALTDPGTTAAAWIQEQVLAPMPVTAAQALERAIDLDQVTLPLLTAISAAVEPSSRAHHLAPGVEWLRAIGVLVPGPPAAVATMRVVPLIAQVVWRCSRPRVGPSITGRRSSAQRRAVAFRAAADWYAGHGLPLAAARSLVRAGDPEGAATLIESRGADMIAAGAAVDLLTLIEILPVPVRDRYGVQVNRADALRTVGEPKAAAAVFAALGPAPDPTWAPALAWRQGMLQYMLGDFPRAAACARAGSSGLDGPGPGEALPTVGSGIDLVLSDVCRASALAVMGKTRCSAALARRALERADALGSSRGLAAAHLATALTSAGARRDEHLAQALAAAERANDVLAQARILTNQVGGLLRQARYPQALELARRAVTAAERGSPPGLLMAALCNAGEALLRLGRFDDAARHFERAVRTAGRVGLNRTAMGLWGLAEGHRQCGRREQARALFEEAIDLARDSGDVQVLVPALTGLARLLLDGPGTEAATAAALVQEAQRVAPARLAAPALVAAGWLGLAGGDLAAARPIATDAVAMARAERRMDHLAEALELLAAVTTDPGRTRSLLHEAEAIWQQAGATPTADRITVLVGRLPGADGDERSAGRAAGRRLSRLGVRGLEAEGVDAPATPVRVRVLGDFEVLVGGRPVPFSAWRSKQARTLVKILVARRGRPVRRDELCELLWPDDDPPRTAHRLSVLLSVVRTVLDPQHLWPVDHYLRADRIGLGLNQAHLAVDAEGLLCDATHAHALVRAGQTASARTSLIAVDQLYRGPAFAEESFEDWAHGLRDEVRAVWLRCLRELADVYRTDGDLRQAATVLVRLLGEDPYDEDSHHRLVRVLVRSGRRGEARRAFDRWGRAMGEIGAPAPDPGVLGLAVRGTQP